MGLISEDVIAQVIDRSDIVETIAGYTALKRAGRNFKALCPFHNEKTPSFVVNPDKQIFHCFGCGAGGNVISFVMKHDHLEFPEAIRLLAERVNVEIPEQGYEQNESAGVRKQILDLNNTAADFFHKNLLSDKSQAAQSARDYLKKRGVELETVKEFRLGFALDEWEGLITFLRGKKISLNAMEKAGLIIAREKKEGYYDRFRNRVVFPIYDTRGYVRAFGARALEKDATAKYINSPETDVYTKGQHVFGFHLARQAITQNDFVIVTEGYMDCVMPYQYGIRNIVAALGTALTSEQIRLIRRYTRNIVLLFDMDPAGEQAMLRSFDTLIDEEMNVKVATLEEGQDPDSFIRQSGLEAFQERVAKAETIFDYKLSRLRNKYDASSVEGKAQVTREMLQTVNRFRNEVLRSGYVSRLAQALDVPETAVRNELAKLNSSFVKVSTQESPKPVANVTQRAVERHMLKLLLQEDRFIQQTKEEILLDDFQDQRIRGVIDAIFRSYESGKNINVGSLINGLKDSEAQAIVSEIVSEEDPTHGDADKIHRDLIARMKADRIKWHSRILRQQISEAEHLGDQDKLERLKYKFHQLIKNQAGE